jgi:putative endonuclease
MTTKERCHDRKTTLRLHPRQPAQRHPLHGVTSDLPKRIWQHKNDQVEGFTKTYQVHMLVWYEVHADMEAAIKREKAIKEWKRLWKLDLIEAMNPAWNDLAAAWEASAELCK